MLGSQPYVTSRLIGARRRPAVDELASMFLKNNYEFISLAEALKDPAYQTEVTSFGNWGISWIDRWAMSAGKKKEFFKEEPATPEYIVELTK